MVTKTELEAELKNAMRSGNEVAKRTLRLVLSDVKLAEVERMESLDEEALTAVLQKQVKTRKETIEDAEKADRPEMIEKTNEELEFLKQYLPEEISDEELKQMSQEAIEEAGAQDPSEMGNVMKILMPRVQGRADGKRVSETVRTLLSNT